jgi:hypothetical protein
MCKFSAHLFKSLVDLFQESRFLVLEEHPQLSSNIHVHCTEEVYSRRAHCGASKKNLIRQNLELFVNICSKMRCPRFRGVLIRDVSSFQGCPY